MSTAIVALCVLVAFGLVIVLLQHLPSNVERYTISVRDLPNTAPDLTEVTPDTTSGAGLGAGS